MASLLPFPMMKRPRTAAATMAVVMVVVFVLHVFVTVAPLNRLGALGRLSRNIDQSHREDLSLSGNIDQSNSEALELSRTTDQNHREALHLTITFDECTGKTVKECEDIIDEMIKEKPALFENQEHLNYVVHQVRQPGDRSYNKLGLMTNMAGNGVVGLLGDGIIKYSNPNFDGENAWCVDDKPCPEDPSRLQHIKDKCCFSIGPWDCDTGVPKSVDECCSYIQSTVPGKDYNGNMIKCHGTPPIGSKLNPVDNSRVYIRINSEGLILGEPKNA